MNFVHSFNTNSVAGCECQHEINTIFGKVSNRSTYPHASNISSCNKILKCNRNCCGNTRCAQAFAKECEEEERECVCGPINNKRLGFCRRKQIMHRRKRYRSMYNEIVGNDITSHISCLLNDQTLSIRPRIHEIQKKFKQRNCILCKSYRPTLCERESIHCNRSISNSKYVATFEEEKAPGLILTAGHNKKNQFIGSRILKLRRWRQYKYRSWNFNSFLNYIRLIMACSYFQQQNYKVFHVLFVLFLTLTQYFGPIQGLLVSKSSSPIEFNLVHTDSENVSDMLAYSSNGSLSSNNSGSANNRLSKNSYILGHGIIEKGDTYLPGSKGLISAYSREGGTFGGINFDKLDSLERSLAAVLIKVAYGTTSTTKRSIPENIFVPSLTTVATPLLTTLRYREKAHQSQLNIRYRNYELNLERDHALPTSAPNADILKSNSNPTYPNPNRHHNHERGRYRHLINSTPKPSLAPSVLKKSSAKMPTMSVFPDAGDIPSYSPPARSFFTPPLPPEYQHPFADKPTLRGTNSEAVSEPSAGSYINRRPIPPPSLMPSHERIPFRPPDLTEMSINNDGSFLSELIPSLSSSTTSLVYPLTTVVHDTGTDTKQVVNTPSKVPGINSESVSNIDSVNTPLFSSGIFLDSSNNLYNNASNPEVKKEVLPSIRRILGGLNGRKDDIPDVLLKQVATKPNNNYYPPSSPVVIVDSSLLAANKGSTDTADSKQNINKGKNVENFENTYDDDEQQKSKSASKPWMDGNVSLNNITWTPSAAAAIGDNAKVAISVAVATSTISSSSNLTISQSYNKNNADSSSSSPSSSTSSISSSTSSTLASSSAYATWSLAWNIHVYLSVILFTILAVYSFYKMVIYNKLSHLFPQSYFICIHLILIIICITRTFYLCYDAYNIHSSFHIFISEILLNLPATFLTISFAVLILFLSLKSLNNKNNRYSALIRPMTVVVGCGVHVVLCITLHYVESYTLQNHQQHLYYQQQQQLLTKKQQIQQQRNLHYNHLQNQYSYATNTVGFETGSFSSSVASIQAPSFHQHNTATNVSSLPPHPPRVLSLICQIIYIFVCFSLGLLYLYLYRILKRILRSKSQNYIHGYQNLSYAIHITIATALLFVLLASLQIFGAISISSLRPLIIQKTAEIDWLQWGYQFSLRLIEIAIITLISWVTSLKTRNGNNTVNINMTNNEAIVITEQISGGNSVFNTNLNVNSVREKHNVHHDSQYNNSNVTNFFLPCTSSSSQEQFDVDYPAVCNVNTNLHTYIMRTGKLIYDDNFALNSLNVKSAAPLPNDFSHPHDQMQPHHQQHSKYSTQATYQYPFDSRSLHESAHPNDSEYGPRINYQPENHIQYNDYLTDNTTDHYENPNFDLRGSGSATSGSALVVNSVGFNRTMQKLTKSSASDSTTTAPSTNNSSMGSDSSSGSSATVQQKMLLLQGGDDTCYSEPVHETYDFNNFEKPKFKQQPHDNWPDAHIPTLLCKRDKKKSLTTLERCYDKTEYRSSNLPLSGSNSNNSAGNSGGGNNSNSSSRYASFNNFEKVSFNVVRKSNTFNNMFSNGLNIVHGRNNSSSSATSTTSAGVGRGTNTLGIYHQQHIPSRNLRGSGSPQVLAANGAGLDIFSRSTIERFSINHKQLRPLNQPDTNQYQAHHHHQFSDNEEDNKDVDIMLSASPHQV